MQEGRGALLCCPMLCTVGRKGVVGGTHMETPRREKGKLEIMYIEGEGRGGKCVYVIEKCLHQQWSEEEEALSVVPALHASSEDCGRDDCTAHGCCLPQ